ncbi:CHAP domain containing protein [uncultured Caudovirales phage]|uniref:CHAP domain containing protein n=1 Tax=uncultured Caudovirales phage TaxID=2100421 RepID=A0A6J7WJQ5_9CAUD|nr:CHAP domain containing protein [uncultured Caudovirales phage]
MPTVDEVLDLSRSQLGNSPYKYWDWYPIEYNSAWCCVYQSWVLTNVGIPTHYAWVSALFDHYRGRGRTSYDVRTATPGALIAFEWDGTGQNSYDHIAMVESVDANGVTAINGNWGGKVTRAWHSFTNGGIAEIAFPEYSNTSSPTPTESSEADMFHLNNTDGRDEFFALASNGMALRCVSAKPSGQLSPWTEIKGGIAGSNLLAEIGKDGRLCVTLAAMGELWGTWQTSPGANDYCDWFKVNDLRKFFGA